MAADDRFHLHLETQHTRPAHLQLRRGGEPGIYAVESGSRVYDGNPTGAFARRDGTLAVRLTDLANEFVKYNHSTRDLIRWLCNSEAYQLSAVANKTNDKPEAEPFFKELRPANKENIEKAQKFVSELKPIGGTAISEALQKAMALRPANSARPDDKPDAANPYVVIFLTDGQPTIGDTSEDTILAAMKKASSGATRVFSFGIGTDVNTHLLDKIASETRAFSQYVLPEESLEVKLSSFYTKIKEPVLSNVQMAFSGRDITGG